MQARPIRHLALAVLLMLVACGAAGRGAEAATTASAPPGHYIVVLQGGASADAVAADDQVTTVHVYTRAIQGFSATLTSAQYDRLLRDPRVNNVVPDEVVRIADPATEPRSGSPLSAAPALPTGVDRIDAEGAALSPPVSVAILDSGIDLGRPEFNVAGAVSFVAGNTTGQDDNGHGTHVAGTAVARLMPSGFRGVAAGAPVYAVKVVDSTGAGSTSTLIAGIDWVTANAAADGIRVANVSLTAAGTNTATCGVSGMTVVDPLHQAICNSVAAGVVYAVAAGNSGVDASNSVPAAYPEVVTVSAVADSDGQGDHAGATTPFGADDTFASFSNFGSSVRLAAPGVDILSTVPTDGCQFCDPSGYAIESGTSSASPHVAGAVAEYVALHSGVSTTGGPGVLAAAAQAVIAAAKPQASFCGFSGDPGGEPMVYVGQPATDCGQHAPPVGGIALGTMPLPPPAPGAGGDGIAFVVAAVIVCVAVGAGYARRARRR
ncbi:MAG TPA: S8 family serine peptidase [Dehalococcoidia bacterium]|nr:S8 family serine peptidase [Dehalococcoidia bacterium]